MVARYYWYMAFSSNKLILRKRKNKPGDEASRYPMKLTASLTSVISLFGRASVRYGRYLHCCASSHLQDLQEDLDINLKRTNRIPGSSLALPLSPLTPPHNQIKLTSTQTSPTQSDAGSQKHQPRSPCPQSSNGSAPHAPGRTSCHPPH